MKLSKDERLLIKGIEAGMRLASRTARKWYFDPKTGKPIERNFGEVVALMHSELSEALEAHRKNLMDDKLPHRTGVEAEFADTIIRIFDTAAKLKLKLPIVIVEKNRFNRTRKDHKAMNRVVAGGKAY